MSEGVRIDRWLWATRLFKTRAKAAGACDAGAVRLGEVVAKPAKRVRVGDTVTIRRRHHDTVVVVRRLVERRGSAAAVADTYDDLTPERPPPVSASSPEVGHRDRGAGRPTKRDRRRIDRLRGREG